MTAPNNFTKGITLKWAASYADYPASLWTLKYTFVNATDKQVVTAAANGDDYAITVAMADTSLFATGRYDYQATVENGTEKYLVETGTTCVIEDFASTSGFDARSQLAITVDAINAYLQGSATNEQQKTRFGEREIWKHSRLELMEIRSDLMRELKSEQQQAAIASGRSPGRKIRTNFI